MERSNGILFVGPTGSGKSYLSNKLFEFCGNPQRFESAASVMSTTTEIQQGGISYCNENFTVLDFPGIYDVSSEGDQAATDGLNTCRLITAIESCESIRAILFVYTGPRFPPTLKIWYDRVSAIISAYPTLSILLLENKATDLDPRTTTLCHMELQTLIRGDGSAAMVPYFRFGYFLPGEDATKSVRSLLETVRPSLPVRVQNPNILELCYKGTEESAPFDELLVSTQRDDGGSQQQSRVERYVTQEQHWDGGIGKIFGKKVSKYFEKFATVQFLPFHG